MNWYKKAKLDPLTFYHGTDEEFETFSLLKDGLGSGVRTGAIWFSDAFGTAQDFGETVREFNLNVNNLYVPERLPSTSEDIQRLTMHAKKEGYDGIIFKNFRDGAYTSNVVGVFDMNKIIPIETAITQENKEGFITST